MHAVATGYDVHAQDPGEHGQDAGEQARTVDERRRDVPVGCGHDVPPSVRAAFF
jgi:hypothetical protein